MLYLLIVAILDALKTSDRLAVHIPTLIIGVDGAMGEKTEQPFTNDCQQN